jgi:hypothetical protein
LIAGNPLLSTISNDEFNVIVDVIGIIPEFQTCVNPHHYVSEIEHGMPCP